MISKRIPILLTLLWLPSTGCDSDPVDTPPDDDEPTEGHVFTYARPSSAPAIQSVSVRGAFNDWGEARMAQKLDGSWSVTVDLDDGTYQYKFFINDAWPTDMCHDQTWGHSQHDHWIDPSAAACVEDGHGGRNAVVVIGDSADVAFRHSSADPAHVSVADGRLSVRFIASRWQVESAAVVVAGESVPMHLQLTSGLDEMWRGSLPESVSEYSFSVLTADGEETFGPYTAPADVFRAVPWVGGAIGYQIFPERFWNGDPSNDSAALETDVVHYMHPDTWDVEPTLTEDWSGEIGEWHCCHQYFGGDIQGIIDRLDHLQALGVSLIYLNPIFTSGSAHGYDTYDYLEVAPNFGDTVVLRRFLDEAGVRSMRVMWDFVPNHVGVGFWAFQDAVHNGEASDYWDWFGFHVPASEIQVGNGNHYEAWWGFGTLPQLETRNTEVFDYLMDVTRHWTEFGFDGIRVDVPMDIRNRFEFFPAFRNAAKAVDADVYLVGEIWERDPSWLQGDQFDALMNYTLGEGVVERFSRGEMTASAAQAEMAALYRAYPEAAVAMLFNLISSHDTSRLLTKLGGGRLGGTAGAGSLARHRLASAFLYALPGVPVTFQGDECAFLGAAGNSRDEHRYPFQWGACDPAMLDHYQRLGTLRQAVHALESPVVRAHEAAGSILSFYRGEPGPGEALVVLNNGNGSGTATLPAGTWVDAETGEQVEGSVPLEALGWRYLERD